MRVLSGRLRRTVLAGTSLAVVISAQVLLSETSIAATTTLTVSTTADVAVSAGACGNPAITTPPSPLSLREATCLANNIGGTVTISLPAGTYNLVNGELQPGTHAGQTVTITGAGAGSTIVSGQNLSRVFDLDMNSVGAINETISGLTIANGADSGFGGAGIIAGSGGATPIDTVTLDSVTVTGNVANGSTPNATNKPGGGVAMEGGALTVVNSTISNNTAKSSPGSGVEFFSDGTAPGQNLTITGSTFSANTATNTNGVALPNGGALAISELNGSAASTYTVTNTRFVNNSVIATSGSAVGGAIYATGAGTLTVTGSTFSGNSVSGGTLAPTGGAIYTSANLVAHYNRFVGNTATTGSALVQTGGSVNATDDWWGCNAGPGSAGCDTVSGIVTTAPRLVLAATASPNPVVGPNATSTVTGSFTTDSAGAAIAGANLGAFTALPVTFSDPPGDATVTLSAGSHNAAIGTATGSASIDYHSGTVIGPDPVNVSFDNATVAVTITVNQPPAITSANSAHFNIGAAGSFTVTTTGYPNPAITESGTLPAGLTFTDNGDGTAKLSGTPTGPGGSFPLAVTANNGVSPNATQTLTVIVGQPPAFTSSATATFKAGTAGSFTVTTSGVPTVSSITESGTLPSGITFTDNGNGTATLAGSPAANSGGTYPVTLTATNGIAPNGTQTLTIQVNQTPVITTNPSNQTVNPGTSVTFIAAASGVPTPTVQWQRSTNGGATYANIAGATSTSYTFTTAAGDDGNRYQAVFTNVAGSVTTTAATLHVGTAPAFTSGNATTFTVGTPGSFSVATSGVPHATLSLTGPVPTWLTLTDNGDGTGSLAGAPPVGSGGLYTFTLVAANGFSPSASQIFTLTVDESPTITSANHAAFTVGSAGTFVVTTTAGYPTTTGLTKTGTLPSGVTFVDNGNGTATLSGTPSAGTAGTYPLTITATATGGLAGPATQSFTLTINGPPVITSLNHATFSVGSPGTFTVTTTAGLPTARTITESGTLPSGVTFVDNQNGTATIGGTPGFNTGGVYPISITASNGVAPDTTQSFTLTVTQGPTITSTNHATFTRGTAAAFTVVTAPGTPAATTITETGALPSGVSFTDNGDGTATLGGTPTGSGGYPITIIASNGVLPNAPQAFTLTVNAPPSITSADHATFTRGAVSSFTVTTSAGTPAARTVTETGGLPSGVSFTDNGDGTATIAGTPTAHGVFPFTITASNGVAPNATQSFTLTVNAPPSITSADHATFMHGASGAFTVTTAAGTPAATTLTEAGALPVGLTFHDNGDGTATLGGTPSAGGVYPLTITASNGVAPNATQAFTLTVNDPPAITSADHATFAVGSAGTFTVTTAPGSPVATALSESGTLPAGVSFTDNGDGTATISGTPTFGAGGVYGLTITASNGVAPDATQAFTLTVNQPPTITSANHTSFVLGTAAGFTVTTASGQPAATTLTETGALPGGTSFTDNGDGTATISGTPTSEGVFPITITASNGVLPDATQAFMLTVNAPPAITNANHATFAVGSAGSFTVTTAAGTPGSTTIIESGALPAGVTFHDNGDGTAKLGGTPASGSGGVYSLTITASNGIDPSAVQVFVLTVNEPAKITSADHATFTVGSAGSFTVATRAGYPVATTLAETGSLPAGVTFTDNGDGTATLKGTPGAGAKGSYPLTITATNAVGHSSQTFTLTVALRSQTISVNSTPPSSPPVGSTYGLAATSDSGLAVAYSIDPATTGAACSLSGSTVRFDHAGTCVIDFDQPGDGTYAAAPQAQQRVVVGPRPVTLSIVSAPSPSVYGQAVYATATVDASGSVQFSVDGALAGSPVTVAAGQAVSPALDDAAGNPLAPGAHAIGANFTPADPSSDAPAVNTVTQLVDQAASATTLAVHPTTLGATLSAVAPGAGTPTGSIVFSVAGTPVGTAPLVDGVATLTYRVPAGKTQQVAAAYSGDADFTASSASASRSDPTITAVLHSSSHITRFGWFRTKVTVTFRCVTHGAPLTAPCPGTATLLHSGAAQSISRTISATDGGTATVVLRGINIDGIRPTVAITGVRQGAVYTGSAPPARCVGKDSLSGVASCILHYTSRGTLKAYTAITSDKAGNTATTRVSFHVVPARSKP